MGFLCFPSGVALNITIRLLKIKSQDGKKAVRRTPYCLRAPHPYVRLNGTGSKG